MDIVNLTTVPNVTIVLAKWHHEEWSYLNPSLSMAQRVKKMEIYLTEDFIPSTYVATDTEVLGSAAIVESDMDTYKHFTPWLASVYVNPAKRGQGIGSKLVKHVMCEAKRNGVKKLYLFTPNQVKFYEKLGWELMFIETYHDHEVHVMCVLL